MRIGILSDSHGRDQITRTAVAMLNDAGAELLVHLGDVETEAVIDELVGHNARLVFGNCDHDTTRLRRYCELLDVTCDHPAGRLHIEDKVIGFTHGHLDRVNAQLLDEKVDYLLHGHSHELRDERVGPTRIINPGALFRAARYTAAVLDIASDELQILEIPPGRD